jgi:hypothetical protein
VGTPKLKFLKRRVSGETPKRLKERSQAKTPLGPVPHVTLVFGRREKKKEEKKKLKCEI